MVSVERFNLGCKYQEIANELARYDVIPRFVWSWERKERVVELLEQEAELDIKLAEFLIEDGDEIGIQMLNHNKEVNANAMWELKQELAS